VAITNTGREAMAKRIKGFRVRTKKHEKFLQETAKKAKQVRQKEEKKEPRA
jgi:hypothetical protein